MSNADFSGVGATAAGLKELQWVEQEYGKVPFPQGFPDTHAALLLSLQQSSEDASEREKRPKGLYPTSSLPDWERVDQGLS